MAEAIGRGRKLDGHEGFYLPAKEFELRFVLKDVCPSLQMWEQAIDDLLPRNRGQEIIQDDPLIVPARLPLRLGKQFSRVPQQMSAATLGGKEIHYAIVKAQHGRLKLRDNHVLI